MKKLRYTGPSRIGVRPGNLFSFTLPFSGCRGLELLSKMPQGEWSFDAATRRISGKLEEEGVVRLDFKAEGESGEMGFPVEFVADEAIALTPPMGWNSWYCFSESVSDEKIRETAQGMVSRGLADHGWSYINIDDCWQGMRGGRHGAVQGNERFPDMAALGAFVHDLGLRFGLYMTPFIGSYAGFRGGSRCSMHGEGLVLPPEKRPQPNQIYGRFPGGQEAGVYRIGDQWLLDADICQWAEWGVDFIKMDWHPNGVPETDRMARALRSCGRDIVLSLSNGTPFENAERISALAQMWRVSGDVNDSWNSISQIAFECATPWLPHSRPGHWNDLDMLQIGALGVPNAYNTQYKPTRLTPEEQKMQMTFWSMVASPLLLSCDLAGMDDWTYSVLTNDDVIAIDQDALGAPATFEAPTPAIRVYKRALANGDRALAYFNMSDEEYVFDVAADLASANSVKELWNASPIDGLRYRLPAHGCIVFRLA